MYKQSSLINMTKNSLSFYLLLLSLLTSLMYQGCKEDDPDVEYEPEGLFNLYQINEDGEDSLISSVSVTEGSYGDWSFIFHDDLRPGYLIHDNYLSLDGYLDDDRVFDNGIYIGHFKTYSVYWRSDDERIFLEDEDATAMIISLSDQVDGWYVVETVEDEIKEGQTYRIRGKYEGPIFTGNDAPDNAQVRVLEQVNSYEEGDLYLSPLNENIIFTSPEHGAIWEGEGVERTDPTMFADAYTRPTDMVMFSYEMEINFYVIESTDKQLRKTSMSGYTQPVSIFNASLELLEGDATHYETIAINQDPNAFGSQVIYAYNASDDPTYGHRLVSLGLNYSEASATVLAGAGASPDITQIQNGPGSSAYFNTVEDLAVDYNHVIYVADGHSIRMVTQGGVVSTFAGQDENGNYLGLPADFEQTHVIKDGVRQDRGFTAVAYDAYNDRIIASHLGNELWAFWMQDGVLQSELIKRSETVATTDGSLEEANLRRPYNLQIDPENGDIYFMEGTVVRMIDMDFGEE